MDCVPPPIYTWQDLAMFIIGVFMIIGGLVVLDHRPRQGNN